MLSVNGFIWACLGIFAVSFAVSVRAAARGKLGDMWVAMLFEFFMVINAIHLLWP